MTGELCLKW